MGLEGLGAEIGTRVRMWGIWGGSQGLEVEGW